MNGLFACCCWCYCCCCSGLRAVQDESSWHRGESRGGSRALVTLGDTAVMSQPSSSMANHLCRGEEEENRQDKGSSFKIKAQADVKKHTALCFCIGSKPNLISMYINHSSVSINVMQSYVCINFDMRFVMFVYSRFSPVDPLNSVLSHKHLLI